MTGYTRQSLADIQNGQDIVAGPLNDEFNALATFADAATGHTHDGSPGSGPKIDLTTSVNNLLPIANGGTNAATATAALTNLGVSAYGKTLIDDADAATARATLGSVIGTNVQAYDAGLQSISGLTTLADRMIYTTALDVYAVTPLTSFIRTVLDDADAATARATLGANDAANLNAGILPAARLSGTYNITNSGNSATATTTTGNAATATLAANSTNFGGQPTSYYAKNDGGTYNIHINGNAGGNAATATLATKASTVSRSGGNGTAMTFDYAGQGGQPTWLWGTNDGTTIQVYNPANFNVNSATTATTASNSTNFGGQPTSYYAKNDGGTYSINITGGSANSSLLNGQSQTSAATANTVVSRDGSGNSVFNRVNSVDVLTNGLNVPKNLISDAGEGISLNGGLFWVSRNGGVAVMIDRETNDGQVIQFGRAKTQVGNVSVTGAATAYNTSSDIRLKYDFQPIDPTLIDQIGVYNFAWNFDDSRAYGVKAQELYEIMPTAVYRGEDPIVDMWSVDYSKLVPLLIAKCQDLEARLAALEI